MKLKSLLVTAIAASFILFGFTFAAPKLLVKIKSSSKLQEQKLNSLNLTRALPRSLFNKHKTDRTQSSRADSLLAELESYYIISGDQLANLPKDIAAEAFPNYIFHLDKLETPPNDPNYRDQWHLKALKAEQAWKIATGKDIAVAVVDAGIDFSAPDLINSLKVNSQEDINRNGKFEPWAFTETRGGVSGDLNGVDEDGNGFADDVVGYDFVNQDVLGVGDWADPDPIPEDEGGHGTPVSAVIAAQANNSIGVVGIAPDAKILACKAFDIEGAAESDDIAAAIIYAARSGAKVINCSFGEIYDSPIVRDAVRYAYERGCFIASSAGNNGWEYAHYPSDYSEVTSVAGINEDMTRWGLSNYGSMPDIAAPSTNILTIRADTAYARYQGTSFSAPCVSGAAALLLEIYPTLTPDEVRSTLMFSSDEAGKKGWDSLYGAGILDPYQALTRKPASVVAIESPQFYQVVSKDKAERLSVVGSVITPLFESYELLAGYGILPDSVWSVAATANNQVKNGELALIDLSNFDKDTVYTIVLKVNQKNGRDIQQRTHLWVTSNATSLRFNDFNVLPAFTDGKRVLLVAASSNRDAGLEIKWRKKGSQDAYASLYDAVNRSRAHIVSLADTLVPGVAYEAIATLRESDSLSVSRSFEFSLNDDYFPTSGFAQKPYRLPRAYFAPVVGDFYGEGKPAVAFSDLSNFGFGYPYLYQFENGDFKF
ncbi:MAG: S8 family serine peptidase, partial [Chloroflexota bacterium]